MPILTSDLVSEIPEGIVIVTSAEQTPFAVSIAMARIDFGCCFGCGRPPQIPYMQLAKIKKALVEDNIQAEAYLEEDYEKLVAAPSTPEEEERASLSIIISPLDDPEAVIRLLDETKHNKSEETISEYKAKVEAVFKKHNIKTGVSITYEHT